MNESELPAPLPPLHPHDPFPPEVMLPVGSEPTLRTEEPKKPKKVKPPSRAERFQTAAQEVLDAVEDARDSIQDLIDQASDLMSAVQEALDSLKEIRTEYEDWQANLPQSLQTSPLGEKLQTVVDIDLDISLGELEMPEGLDEAESAAQECLETDLPLGFGRD